VSGPREVIAVLGLGEAGSAIAADLVAAGALVRGFDPVVPAGPGITQCDGDADACRGAAVVLSLTCAHEAEAALKAALPGVGADALYADLNTASAGFKGHLAELAAGAGITFADVAMLSPVPGLGLRTPMLACGPAAPRFADILTALGARVDVLPGPPGTAAVRKLVRSVFYKGLAAAVTEALRAARSAGCEDWLRSVIAAELSGFSAATVDRLENGSIRHARRRAEEMAAAAELLSELGVPARIAGASEQWLRDLLAESADAVRLAPDTADEGQLRTRELAAPDIPRK
jgi:3-hydroxyisobutyrate dehydrogenase-like beta-hydroxyacid dehydrogenase